MEKLISSSCFMNVKAHSRMCRSLTSVLLVNTGYSSDLADAARPRAILGALLGYVQVGAVSSVGLAPLCMCEPRCFLSKYYLGRVEKFFRSPR